jgi:hypothetical protein
MRTIHGLATATFVGLFGCGSDAPSVVVLNAAPLQIDPARDEADDLSITVHYEDSNGDLGRGFVEVHDCRADGLVSRFSIPALASDAAIEKELPIEGELTILVADIAARLPSEPPPACRELDVGVSSDGTQSFCVFATDSAGKRSEGDCTLPVRVLQPAP